MENEEILQRAADAVVSSEIAGASPNQSRREVLVTLIRPFR